MAALTFAGPTAFAAFLVHAQAQMRADTVRGMTAAARLVQREARAAIGEYQPGTAPFGPWPPLAPSTVAEKTRLGYAPPDRPLLRTGEMRESIAYNVDATSDGAEAEIGSDSEIALYQEVGTRTIPPRSFLGLAAARRADDIVNLIGGNSLAALHGQGRSDVLIDLP